VVSGLTPGHYTIQAQAGPEVDGQVVDIHSNETVHVTLTSRGIGKIEGRVTELGDNAPVAGMRCDGNISVGGLMPNVPPDESRQAFTDADGRFSVAAPIGTVRVFCFIPGPGPAIVSAAGTDVEVSSGAVASVALVAVRAKDGTTGKPGFGLAPGQLPMTVTQVDPNGPAASSGLLVGDQLVAIDGASLQGMLPPGAMTAIQNHGPGNLVVLGVVRGGTARTIPIVLSD
jgi:membrane-associated protease RseP (regulator of RpoE activity)